MQNLKLLLGVIFGTLIMVFGVAFLFSSNAENTTKPVDMQLAQGERRLVKTAKAIEETPTGEATEVGTESSEATTAGDASSLTTIVEFSDLQCPACRAAQPLLEQIISANPGQYELVYRHFPLESIHQNAKLAAVASEVMADQNLFWEFHDLLFEEQEAWATESDPTAMFKQYATDLEADVTDFEAKLKDSLYIDRVEADIRDGYALGVDATPTFYVDGQKMTAQELSQFVSSRL
jgi:protein-disulfide isomerase